MNAFLDVRAIPSCVQQIAQTKKMLQNLNGGDVLTVRFLDELMLVDFKALCERMDCHCSALQSGLDFFEIYITLSKKEFF